MLNTALSQFWQLLLIVGTLTLIVFLIVIMITLITGTIDVQKQRRIKDQNIKDLQIMFDELITQMQEEEKEEQEEKKTKKRKTNKKVDNESEE